MNGCGEIRPLLDDLVDGELGPDSEPAVLAHIESCAVCRLELEELRSLVAAARSLPRTLAVERDLWPRIAARLGGGAAVDARRPILRVLAMAAALVAAVALGALLAGHGQTAIGTAPRNGSSAPAGLMEASWRGTDAELIRLSGQLERIFNRRRDSLSPQTRTVIEENLKVIDQAIVSIERALRHEPDNADLRRLLFETRRDEVDLLWRASQLPAQS